MSVPVDVSGTDGRPSSTSSPSSTSRTGASLDTVRAPRPPARTGAAKRAYDKRRQRAMLHENDPHADRTTRSVAGRIPFVASIIGLLAIGLASTLLLSTRAAEDSYVLSAGRADNQALTEQAAALQRDFEIANSAPELARRATKLGMIPTKDVARLLVQPDGMVQVIGTPAPAAGPPAPDFASATPAGSGVAGANPAQPARPGAPSTSGEVLTPVTRGATSAPPTTSAAPTTTSAPAQAPAAQAVPAPAPAVGEQQVPISGGAR